ncbi:DUF92 domain-containing protein [Terracidiphilus gabretensis]|uniref:DUF92 domain-containing protein n=1 Tax=Terracidiphilus gabretensis TaxID=1577687 RepID=UPI00071BF09C|nr:DUF92 domain-containing protein [Terracidiphilus gabretensis]
MTSKTDPQKLAWQSRLILAIVIAPIAVSAVWETRFWALHEPRVAMWALGLSALLGLAAWKSRSGTPAAAATGALLCASMMFSTFVYPYEPWKTAIVPVLAVLVLTSLATRVGRRYKEQLGTAEEKRGRVSAQVCANLGFAALVCSPGAQSMMAGGKMISPDNNLFGVLLTFAAYASLAEAAADTVSSEIGQVLGGQPFMLTTFRRVEPGTDGAVSASGTLAGVLAACIIGTIGVWVLQGNLVTGCVISAGGIFGLIFDSLLGATLERKGWLNNDAVNFLSTASAAISTVIFVLWTLRNVAI